MIRRPPRPTRTDTRVPYTTLFRYPASLSGALTGFLIAIAPNPYATAEVIDWLMGALTDRGWADVRPALPFLGVGALLLLLTAPALDALTLGEAAARSMGVRLGR